MGLIVSAHQTATVNVRGHNFTADFLPIAGELPTVLRLWLVGYQIDVLQIISDDALHFVRVEVQKRYRDIEICRAHSIDLERLES